MNSTATTQNDRTDWSNATCKEFNWDDPEGAAMAIIEVVAAVTDQSPTAMEPLDYVVDTDGLSSLFQSTASSPRNTGSIELSYEGCLVRIHSDGTVAAVKSGQTDWDN